MSLHSFAAVVAVVLVYCLLAPPAIKASSLDISTYWGTSNVEGGLKDACNTLVDNKPLYNIVNIGFVDNFGPHHNPTLNINHPCDPSSGGCKYLGEEIQSCQNMGIKVLISIGGPGGHYNLTSADNAVDVAEYLWHHYLGGLQSGIDRPLGDNAILDGVDFFIEAGTTQYWDVLAAALRTLSSSNGTQMELSATPKCKYPDHYLDDAIQTGLFDYVQVRFYNETGCQYDGSFDPMKSAWDEWTAKAPVDKIFAGVTAFEDEEGYVDPNDLFSGFLDYAMESPKFGGVMVWNRFSDHNTGYSKKLKS